MDCVDWTESIVGYEGEEGGEGAWSEEGAVSNAE